MQCSPRLAHLVACLPLSCPPTLTWCVYLQIQAHLQIRDSSEQSLPGSQDSTQCGRQMAGLTGIIKSFGVNRIPCDGRMQTTP